MPIHRGSDSQGAYYQWGGHGHKYHFKANNASSRSNAHHKAEAQAAAAHAHGYNGHHGKMSASHTISKKKK